MQLAKDLVSYYADTTGKNYDDFYSKISEALNTKNPTGETWLVSKMLEMITAGGISIDTLVASKDAIRGAVDSEKRKLEGEFYTPEIWCSEGRTYFDKYVPDWKEFNVWDGSCGMGNLMKTSGHSGDKLFLSTLREEDAEVVQSTFPDATVFALDFLSGIDYDNTNLEFLSKLPVRLQEIIKNDEPLIIYMNPPYKSGSAKNTDVGVHMSAIGLGRAATDIFYQFIWRVMSLAERFHLKNTWFGVFGPLTFFMGIATKPLLTEFEHSFEFVDGMCLSAQEFSGTSSTIPWGIGYSLWKSRGGYQKEGVHCDVLLDKKYRLTNGGIESRGKILYAQPRVKLSKWVIPDDVMRYDMSPCATSFNSFKDYTVKCADGSLGSLMLGNTLIKAASQSAILTLPTSVQFVDITKENFWRCIASFSSRRLFINSSWAVSKKDLSAPITTIAGYDTWLYNSIVLACFEGKALQSGLRGIDFSDTKINVPNRLFFLSQDEIRENTMDEVLLKDMDENPPANEFFLEMLELSKPYWVKPVRDLFEFGKNWMLTSLDARKSVEYKECTDAWDAGFAQIRASLWNEELEKELSKHLSRVRDYLRIDLMKFGFVSDIDE